MKDVIIDSFWMDLKRDVPKEMEVLSKDNEKMQNVLSAFKTVFIVVFIGGLIYYGYEKRKRESAANRK
jgi:cbb3-type cytochrome oxidase subunit 3